MDRRDRQTFETFPSGRGYPWDDYGYSGYESYGGMEKDHSGRDWLMVSAATLLGAMGGYLLYQSLSSGGMEGNSKRKRRFDRGKGIEVNKSITVQKPVEELYGYWRELENLPRIMSHLESVKNLGTGRSHWIAKAPAGMKVEWNASITQDRPNELLAWRAAQGADVPNEGIVRFRDRGTYTDIHVSLRYLLPGGALGAAVAKLFGEEPAQQIDDDLRHFKEEIESGQINTSAYRQPSGQMGGTAGL